MYEEHFLPKSHDLYYSRNFRVKTTLGTLCSFCPEKSLQINRGYNKKVLLEEVLKGENHIIFATQGVDETYLSMKFQAILRRIGFLQTLVAILFKLLPQMSNSY